MLNICSNICSVFERRIFAKVTISFGNGTDFVRLSYQLPVKDYKWQLEIGDALSSRMKRAHHIAPLL
jgi:hypothetical protein